MFVTATGTVATGELRYHPFGKTRYTGGTTPTSQRYTGQREEGALGLYFYGARWYDPSLGRFVQPDTLVPQPGDAADWDRFAYVRNNPLKLVDPSGHRAEPGSGTGGRWDVVDYIVKQEMLHNLHSVPAESIRDAIDLSDRLMESAMAGHGPEFVYAATGARSNAYTEWILQVMPGAEWDHKSPIKESWGLEQPVDGQIYTFDTWSNIHYGYIGRSLGFSADELLYGAGIAQLLDETSQGFPHEAYNEYLLSGNAVKTYLDNGNDPAFIQFGIALWDQYGEELTRAIFLEELSSAGLSIGVAK